MVPALPALRDGGASVVPRLRSASLRLRGGDGESADAMREIRRRRAETDGDEEDANGMKAAAKRRAEQARRAGSFSSNESLSKTAYRVLSSASNKIGLTVRAHMYCTAAGPDLPALPATAHTDTVCVARGRRRALSMGKSSCAATSCRSSFT